jgi:hypothetical protein
VTINPTYSHAETEPWGIKVARVEMKNVGMPGIDGPWLRRPRHYGKNAPARVKVPTRDLFLTADGVATRLAIREN